MAVMVSQPRVNDFQFRLFNRSLHPELLDVIASRSVTRGQCSITVLITTKGHILQWNAAGTTAVEITSGPDQLLPRHGQLIDTNFEHSRSGHCRLGANIRYRMLTQVERLSAADFEVVHDEILIDGRNRGLLVCRPAYRCDYPALSWIDVTPLVGGLAVTAIHSFPNERALAKSQSLIEPFRVQ